jgi:hypothetical protein
MVAPVDYRQPGGLNPQVGFFEDFPGAGVVGRLVCFDDAGREGLMIPVGRLDQENSVVLVADQRPSRAESPSHWSAV